VRERKYDEDPIVREKYRQSQRRKTRASTAKWSCCLKLVRGLGCNMISRHCRRM